MNDTEIKLKEWAELDCDTVDLDELESKLDSELEEQMIDLESLEKDREKIGNPDSIGETVMNVVWEQFINQVGVIAGEDFIKENRGLTLDLRDDAHIQTTENFANGKIATHNTKIDYQKARFENGKFFANIPILDVQYGNVWSSLPRQLMLDNGIKVGDMVNVSIYNEGNLVWNGDVKLVNTFGDVPEGDNMAYFNSELNFSVAVNMGNFSDKYKVYSGPNWSMEIIKK